MTETIFGLFKAGVIWPNGPWRSLEEVEFATLGWVDWFNNRRLLEPIGDFPPAEFEAMFYERLESPALEARLREQSLRDSRRGSIGLQAMLARL